MSRKNQHKYYNRLAESISFDLGIPKKDALFMCDVVTNTIKKLLLNGFEVFIPKMGTLFPKFSEGKSNWLNPKTGYDSILSESFKLKFKSTRLFDETLTKCLLGGYCKDCAKRVFHGIKEHSITAKLKRCD